MVVIRFISGPLIGAFIGYFTNYIAVRMLFYPRKEIYLFGHKLPFTPGAIPRGRARLASAVGHTVSDSLLTRQDIENLLLSEEVKEHVTGAIMKHFSTQLGEEICDLSGMSKDEYREKREELSRAVSREIVDSINVRSIMEEFGADYLKEKIHSRTLGKLISSERIDSVAFYIADDLQTLVNEKGPDYIKKVVDDKVASADSRSLEEIINANTEENNLSGVITDSYCKLVRDNIDRSMSHIDIAAVIEDKINSMPIDELEKMILSVMKQELNTIVSLGALIGVILGFAGNLF